MRQRIIGGFLLGSGLLSLAFLSACGGKGGGNIFAQDGTITVTVSDPSTCGGANGPFSHIYVTISSVQLVPDQNAAPGNPGTNLGFSLKQVDLLGTPNQCFLATLGSKLMLPPGVYPTIKVFLANSGNVAGNHCGLTANCVMLKSDPLNTPQPIQLGTGTTPEIDLGSDQIVGGSFTAVADQPQTLNLNLDGCASVVTFGPDPNLPQFRFKPVLLAGDTGVPPGSLSNSITGTVVDSATQVPIPNGRTIVALEKQDTRGLDRVIMETLADGQGAFSFCPVPPGTYDVVAAATDSQGNAFAATVTLGVQPGNALGNVPLIAVPGATTTPAVISGTVDTADGLAGAASADITLSALQQVPQGSTGITIPLIAGASSSTLVQATENLAGCPANFDCSAYSLDVPPANPNAGVFNAAGTVYAQGNGAPTFTVEAVPSLPLSGATPGCSPSFLTSGPVPVSPGVNVPLPAFIFGGCQ